MTSRSGGYGPGRPECRGCRRLFSAHATRRAGRGLEHRAPAGGRRPPGSTTPPRLLPQGGPAARRPPGRRRPPDRAGRGAPARLRRRGVAGRRGQGRRGSRRVRDLRRARRRQRRGGPRPDPRRQGDRHPRAVRGGGAADVPRRPPLVRLVVGPAARGGHRRRLAGDRVRDRRGTRRGVLAAARRRPAHPRPVHRGPAAPPTRSASCAGTSARRSPGGSGTSPGTDRPTTRSPRPRPSSSSPGSAAPLPRPTDRTSVACWRPRT